MRVSADMQQRCEVTEEMTEEDCVHLSDGAQPRGGRRGGTAIGARASLTGQKCKPTKAVRSFASW